MDVGQIFKRNMEGVWLEFMPGVKLQIKAVSPAERVKLVEDSTHREMKSRKQIEYLDAGLFNVLLAQKAVVGWTGIEMDGKELKCTPENIKLLMDGWNEFNAFVQDAAINLEKHLEEQKEEAEKNS